VEIGNLIEPWPDWLLVEPLSSENSLVGVARRLFSSNITDGLPTELACDIARAIVGPDAEVHAWFLTQRDYRSAVVEALGQRAVKGFVPYRQRPLEAAVEREWKIRVDFELADLLEEEYGLLVLCCPCSQLGLVGLPPTFLTAAAPTDRIGLAALADSSLDFTRCPSYDELLERHQLLLVPGGFHYTDCLIASATVPPGELVERVRAALKGLNYDAQLLGDVTGDTYDRIAARSRMPDRLGQCSDLVSLRRARERRRRVRL